MITNSKKLLQKAYKEGYAIGAFNVYNIETVNAVISAAEKAHSPVIIQTSTSAIKYAGLPILSETIKIAAKASKIPVVLHLDHARNVKIIKKCIEEGYTSIMIDASSFPLRKNIDITKKIVKIAHSKGVSIEAELGTLGGKEDETKGNIAYTDPSQASIFCKETGIDSLAVAIGTSHGIFKSHAENLKISTLKEIKKKTGIPLVLHGASLIEKKYLRKAKNAGINIKKAKGIKKSDIRRTIKAGVAKINVDTDLRIVFSTAIREFYSKNKENINPRDALYHAQKAVEKAVIEHIKLFGSKGKA